MTTPTLQALFRAIDRLTADEVAQLHRYLLDTRITYRSTLPADAPPATASKPPFWFAQDVFAAEPDTSWEGDS